MICRSVLLYCKDDIRLIENYDEAINDKTKRWDCHHRLETELNVSRQYLIDNNLYYDRPASEFIFLTHNEHVKIHNFGKDKKGKEPWNKGKVGCYSEETIIKMKHKKTEEARKNMSISKLGKHRIYDDNGKFHYE